MSFQLLPFSQRAQSRVIKQQSTATVQHLVDAVVELATNCDDSYSRLEDDKKYSAGKIEIYVIREKGGKCKEFRIKDCAEGMDREKLLKAIGYGEETSGFTEGKTVRGLLGRGLKESIIGLGEGEVYTKKHGVKYGVKICEVGGLIGYDNVDGYDSMKINDLDKNKIDSRIFEFLNSEEDGTLVRIKVKNEKIRIPEKFELQIRDHYALRGINSSENREFTLIKEDFGRKKGMFTSQIKFTAPKGELVFDDIILSPVYKSSIRLKIWESPDPLFFQRYDSSSIAGFLIKTNGAVLDNKLFKYESEPAALYFWGEAYCEDIADRLLELAKDGRESEIIDLGRKGLNWNSDYCSAIRKAIEKALSPFIQRKKESLESGEKNITSPKTEKMLRDVSKLLDKLAKKEFKEWEGPEDPKELNIESLVIIPTKANIEIDESRTFSIYVPKELVESQRNKAIITSDCQDIKIVFPGSKRLVMYLEINLKPHPKDSNIYYNFFKVRGRELDKQANISCRLGKQEVSAIAIVKKPTKRQKERRGGFISKIEESNTSSPIQRVGYDKGSGAIKIYIKFPGIAKYFPSGLKEIEQKGESKVMLAELVGETFCRELARRKLEEGGMTGGLQEGQIDAFLSKINEFQRKYLDKIHEIILNRKL